jgi:hypothetical protein
MSVNRAEPVYTEDNSNDGTTPIRPEPVYQSTANKPKTPGGRQF